LRSSWNSSTSFAGTAAASLYWISLALAQLFPDTAWHDPEFDAEVSHPLGLDPQQLLGYVLCGLLIAAIALTLWRH
jgi:hypothetical protein